MEKDSHSEENLFSFLLPLFLSLNTGSSTTMEQLLKLSTRVEMLEDDINKIKKII